MSEQIGPWPPPTSGPIAGPGVAPFRALPVLPAETSGAGSGLGPAVSLVVGVLLLLSAALPIIGLFPPQGPRYPAGSAVEGQIVEQAILAAGWLAAAVIVLFRRPLSVAACMGAVGIGLAQVGLAVTDFAGVAAVTRLDIGAWLGLVAWIPGLAGAAIGLCVAARMTSPTNRPGRPRRIVGARGWSLTLATLVVGVGLGVALLLGWGSYSVTARATHRTIIATTLGDAFAHGTPTGVLIGTLLGALALVFVPLLAVMWRPTRGGVALSGGVLVVIAARAIAEFVHFREALSVFSRATVTNGRFGPALHFWLSGWFIVQLVAAVALLVLVIVKWRLRRDDGQLAGPSFANGVVGSGAAVAHDGGGWPYRSGSPWAGGYPPFGAPSPPTPPRPEQ